MTGPVRIQSMDCLEQSLELIRQHGLFLGDRQTSHTQMVLEEHEDRRVLASPILHTWIAFQGEDPVGVAMVCKGSDETGGLDTVSLYVKPVWRGQGLGEDLLETVLARCPAVAGFHTPEAQGLYGRKGLPVAFFSREDADAQCPPEGPCPAEGRAHRRRPG